MEGSKGSGGEKPTVDHNPSPNPPSTAAASEDNAAAAAAAAASADEDEARRPFTALSQVDADLALARVLQEQERAYMMLRMNGVGGEGSDYGSSEAGSYEYDEEAEEDYEEELEHHLHVHHHEQPIGDVDVEGNVDIDVEGDVEGEGDHEGSEGSQYEDDDDEVEAEVDPAEYEDDEAYARALQDAEEHEVAARLLALAGISDWRAVEHIEEQVNDPQLRQIGIPTKLELSADIAVKPKVGKIESQTPFYKLPNLPSVTLSGNCGIPHRLSTRRPYVSVHIVDAWQEVDPDEYSYEELVALGEVVGTESRGLCADTLASLPSVTYKTKDVQDDNTEQCVICRVEFEEGESLIALPCKHSYHPECINQWLQINKVCPMCSAEVSTSEKKQS